MAFRLPERDPCPFCEYVTRGVTHDGHGLAVVAERRLTLSFIDLKPHREGHVLVIPKRHAPTVLDLEVDEAHELISHVQDVVRAQLAALDAAGVNAFQNNGVAAGQSVAHYHMHVVPRVLGDGVQFRPEHERAIAPEADRLAMARRLRAALPPIAAEAAKGSTPSS